jgi:hypothetical protein
MKLLKTFLKAEERHKRILELLLAIYIIFNIDTPMWLALWVDSPIGNVMAVLLALTMFAAGGPIAGVLALIAAHTLIRRSSRVTGSYYTQADGGAETIKMEMLDKYNDFPKTLEEEVVDNMAPLVRNDGPPNLDYKPLLDSLHNAAPIDYEGVI